MTAPRSQFRPRLVRPAVGGFTLIELILVMVIMVVVMAIASPMLQGFARGRYSEHAAAHLIAVAGWAQNKAMSEGTVYRLNLDVPRGTYWLTTFDGNSWTNPGDSFGRRFTLPENVRMETNAPTDGGVQVIPFFPGGRTEPASVWLIDTDRHSIQLGSPSATERFQAIEPGGS